MKWLFLLGALVAQGVLGVERVVDFHSTIRIGADGVLSVTERIAVQAEGNQIRRGILRDFPTDYRDRLGNRVNVPFEVLGVKRNGAPERFALEPLANGKRIRIGRGDATLQPGVHTYEIEYRTARQVGHFPDHDELYWNVNGNGWTFPFDHISAEVHLPKAVPAAELRGEAYTGAQGARGRNYQQMFRDGAAGFRSTRPFAPYEGMTIVVGFPKGLVAEPGAATRLGWFLNENRGVGAGVAGLALTLIFLWWRWLLVGRDPSTGPAFPRYEAPKGLSAGAVRFIDRQGYDDRCFAAALLGLGSRGLWKIMQTGEYFLLRPTGRKVDLLPGESTVAVLSGKIGGGYDERVGAARDALERELQLLYAEKVFSRNTGSLVSGLVAAVITLGAMFILDAPLFSLFAVGVVLVVMLVAFYHWLPAYSVAGRRLQDEIAGLRQYLGVAEKDDLARAKAPPRTAEEFSRFLPYAVALDVEKTWADRFATVLGTAAVAHAVSEWYQSSSTTSEGHPGSFSNFTHSFSEIAPTVAAASSPPASSSGFSSDSGSSSSSSSGSSGGGGGGGGGSGW